MLDAAATGPERLRRLLDEQIALLDHGAFRSCANRQGLRERSGSLLEAAFLDLVVQLTPTLSIEIGAHEAAFSERLKKRLPTVHALAFEANPFVYRLHMDRLRQPAVDIDYRHAAICDEDGTIEFQVPIKQNDVVINPDTKISSLFRRMAPGFEYDTMWVPGFTLDTVLKTSTIDRSVAWIDAEGAQREILAGGRRYFAKVQALYIELETRRAWREQMLDGEIAKLLSSCSLIPIMRDSLADIQYNKVFIRLDEAIVDIAIVMALRYVDALRKLIDPSIGA
jgi:FkbM family methyltransferase